jgi:hypothetical protein
VRDTVADGAVGGRSVEIENSTALPADVTVRQCLLERSVESAITVVGSDALVESTLVRDVAATSSGSFGRGINAQASSEPAAPVTNLHVRSSVIERVHDVGIVVEASSASIEATVIRDVAPASSALPYGRGLAAQYRADIGRRAVVTLSRSLIERTHEVAASFVAADATIESSILRDTLPRPFDGRFGVGIEAQYDVTGRPDPATRTLLAVRWSLIDANLLAGIIVIGSELELRGALVRDTAAEESDRLFGDGLVLLGGDVRAAATVTASRIEGSARAGLASFAGTASISDTQFECNAIDLDGEELTGAADFGYTFDDQGLNHCGCGDRTEPCSAQTTHLQPPTGLP